MMSDKCLKTLVILLLCVFISGCIGIGGGIITAHSAISHDKIEDHNYNVDYIKSHSKVKLISDKEAVYISDEGFGWTGSVLVMQVLFVPVPVPLIIPTRKNYMEYHLISGKVQSATHHFTAGTSTMCFMGYGPESEATMKYEWMFRCKSEGSSKD